MTLQYGLFSSIVMVCIHCAKDPAVMFLTVSERQISVIPPFKNAPSSIVSRPETVVSVFNWLLKNAHNYGFILRYPKDKTYLTGYEYESWHFRYLGVDLATKVYNEGITYDEYYAYYLDN